MRHRLKAILLVVVCVIVVAALLLFLRGGPPPRLHRTASKSGTAFGAHDSLDPDSARVVGILKNAIKADPKDAALYYDLGKAYLELHDLDQSITNLSVAIRLKTNEPAAYNTRGLAFFERREFSKALSDFNKCLELDPNHAKAYHNRGLVYLKLRDTNRAIADFTTASNLSRGSARPLIARASAYQSMGKWSEATADLKDAVTREPDNPLALNALAWILATSPDRRVRDGAQAERFARKACELTNWGKWYCVGTLAAAYAELGDYRTAVSLQKRSLASGDLSPSERQSAEGRLTLFEKQKPFRDADVFSRPAPRPEATSRQ